MATTPNLGYGNRAETSIDTFNQWLRAQPEYTKLIQSFGQSPDNVHLNDGQKQQVVRLAQSLGAVVDEGGNGQEVDDSGNFRAKGHKLRNTLIVAGIAGAALLTMGAAGVLGGGAGAAAGGAEGAAGAAGATGATEAGVGLAGLLPATTTVPLSAALPAGLTGSAVTAGAGAGAAAGAGAGLADLAGDSAVLPSTATAAGSAELPAGLAGTDVVAGTPAAAGPLASTPLAQQAASQAPATNLTGITGATDAGSKLSQLTDAANALKNVGTGIQAINSSLHNGSGDPTADRAAAAANENQLAKNRAEGERIAQLGPQADRTALGTIGRAGLIGGMSDFSAPYANSVQPHSTVDPTVKNIYATYLAKMKDAATNGTPLTTFAVPPPTPEELAAHNTAMTGSPTGSPNLGQRIANGANAVSNGVNTAANAVNAGKKIYDLFSGLWT